MSASKRGLYPADAYERDANDFYETPSWVSEVLLNTMRLRGTVWEPCGGNGALALSIDGNGRRPGSGSGPSTMSHSYSSGQDSKMGMAISKR